MRLTNPDAAAVFDVAMVGVTQWQAQVVVAAHDFSACLNVMDWVVVAERCWRRSLVPTRVPAACLLPAKGAGRAAAGATRAKANRAALDNRLEAATHRERACAEFLVDLLGRDNLLR